MTDPSHPKVISESVDVDAPPEVVFAILSDPRQHARIDGSGSVRELVKGPERLSKGATFGMDMKLFGLPYKIRNTVVEYDENRQIAWRHFGGHRWRYVLEPTEWRDAGHRVVRLQPVRPVPTPGRGARRFPEAQPRGHRRDAGQAPRGGGVGREGTGRVSIRVGTEVSWKWGSSEASGKVTEIHREKVTRTTKGSEITRNGSEDDPAYVIEQEDGTTVLKLRSEVEPT